MEMGNGFVQLFNSPVEILETSIRTAKKKVSMQKYKVLILSILAGLYISFAAFASTMASFSLLNDESLFSLGKLLFGSVFSAGLILIIACGGELFTGNCLIVTGVFDESVKIKNFLNNLIIVYFGNFIGAFAFAIIIYGSGLLNGCSGEVGAFFVKIAANKVNLGVLEGQALGMMCNILVCLGVLISYAGTTLAGKILGIYFPIMIFATSGFEHCVANMFYIPLGIMARNNIEFVNIAGLSEASLSKLNFVGFFIDNLIPVTLGNILGGVIIGALYWACYHRKKV